MKWVNNKKSALSEQGCALALLMTALIVLLSTQVAKAESYNIDMRGADIDTLIQTVSQVTGKKFVLDSEVAGKKVTVIGNTEVESEDLYEVLLSVLSVNGMTVVETGKVTKVITSNKSKYQSMPFFTESELESKSEGLKPDAFITTVVSAKHVPVSNLVPILRPMVSPTGHMQSFMPSNSLLVADSVSNVKKIVMIVRSMDLPDDDKIEIVYLRNALVTDVSEIIKRLRDKSDKAAPKKYKISVDTRTNSLLIEGSEFVRSHLKGIILGLDQNKEADGKPDDAGCAM